MSDSFRFDITSEGPTHFALALGLAFDAAPGGKATGYRVDKREGMPRLIFYWSATEGATSLPFKMTAKEAQAFAEGWLRDADYGDEPDHDGSNHKGWRCYNEAWGHVAGEHYAFVGIEPSWQMYGK